MDKPAFAARARARVWGLCLVSMLLTVALVQAIRSATGLDLFSILCWGFLPVGAMGVALLAMSGYALGATWWPWRGTGLDLLFLMVVCLLLQLLVVAAGYWTLRLAHPGAGAVLSYAQYFARSVTLVEYVGSGGAAQAQPVGVMGWLLLLPRIGALLAMARVFHGQFGGAKAYASY